MLWCVDRLRAQNKESSDAWTRRTAELQSRHDGLRFLMDEARDLNRKGVAANGVVIHGLSGYGQAALAAAIRIADEAEAEVAMLRESFNRERRHRAQLEDQIAKDRERIAREARRAAAEVAT